MALLLVRFQFFLQGRKIAQWVEHVFILFLLFSSIILGVLVCMIITQQLQM